MAAHSMHRAAHRPLRTRAQTSAVQGASAQRRRPSRVFHFSQFSLHHDGAAMKMGTDAMLLGAWAKPALDARHILDVGTGSGVLALMAAQRAHADARVDAIDVEQAACVQAASNVAGSPWPDRISVYHMSLQDMQQLRNGEDQRDTSHQSSVGTVLSKDMWRWPQPGYDMIVCNPPYFVRSYLPPGAQQEAVDGTSSGDTQQAEAVKRALARHAGVGEGTGLTYEVLVGASGQLLRPGGELCVILPADEGQADTFTDLASLHSLILVDCLSMYPSTDATVEKRRLMRFKLTPYSDDHTHAVVETRTKTQTQTGTDAQSRPAEESHSIPCKRLSIYKTVAESNGELIGGQPHYTADYLTLTRDFHHPSFFAKYARTPVAGVGSSPSS